MKAMFDLKGEITNCKIYFRSPKCVDNNGFIDMQEVEKMGFNTLISVNNIYNCEIVCVKTNDLEPKIEILSTNYRSVIKPISNVQVDIHRSYCLYDWVRFWLYKLWKKIN